ncbi:hypothetical protein [Actinoplanes sp. GCM10030250]|uniref:DUF6197 family protein n=1 Tax=Actinoplanes sp. GCM10030250 TaxID=3273376 RepID=UPI00360E778D
MAAMKATHEPFTTTVDTGMTPPELLRGAALYLGTHGWFTGGFFDFASGRAFPQACTLGAINIAAYGRAALGSDDHVDDANTDAAITAMRVFAAHIDPGYDPTAASAIDIVGDWNDEEGRTLAEVVEALNDAADDWDRAHTPGGAR